MRFEDVSDRLGAIVSYAGLKDDGKPFNVAMPHMEKMRIWQAVYGSYSWSIVFEPGVPTWTDDEKVTHQGYTASYRKIGQTTSNQTIRIDGGPWLSFAKAEEACKRRWKQIRNAA